MMKDIEKLDGFWVCKGLNRTLHIGFEDEETLYFDLFDSADANKTAEGNDCITAVFLNIRTGKVKIDHEPTVNRGG